MIFLEKILFRDFQDKMVQNAGGFYEKSMPKIFQIFCKKLQ